MLEVSILGSCTVIKFPEQVEQFFRDKNLVDRRNSHLMEMDALPLLFLAQWSKDVVLSKRIKQALIENLIDSGGELWKCGVWGHDETHCRFSSVALRLMILNQQDFDASLLRKCLTNHLGHHEQALDGIWFYHDSIETKKQPYYKTWTGKTCSNTSANNMLILNTHLDTLITLLMAKKLNVLLETRDNFIHQGLKALNSYYAETEVVSGIKAKVDSIARSIVLRGLGKRDIVSRGSVYLLQRFYYRIIRYAQKHRQNIRAFSDGFLERDVRLTGPSLEYHVVNLWDISRLLLWQKYNEMAQSTLDTKLIESAVGGLKYCLKSTSYRSYIQRLSIEKGVNNEVLEAIAILAMLGHRHAWMGDLYLDWRKFAPPSAGVLGIDKTISVNTLNGQGLPVITKPESVDWIPFDTQLVFVANNGTQDFNFDAGEFFLEWQSTSNSLKAGPSICVKATSIAVLRIK